MANAVLARRGEAEDRRAAGEHRARPERERLGDVGAAPDAAVEVDLGAACDRVDHLRQRVERGGSAVELAAAVVRDDDRRRAVLDRELGVLGGDDALQHDGQLRLARDPLEVAPRDRGVEQRELVGGILRRVADRRAGVRERQVRGDLEADAQVTLALREARRVDGEDDGAAAGIRGLREMLARDAAVLEDVELAPLQEPRRGGRDLLVRARGERRDGHARARRGGAARRRALAVGVVELLVGDRRDEDRQLDRRCRAPSSPSRSRTRRRGRAAGTSSARTRRGSRAASTRRPSRRRGRPTARLEPLLGEPLVVRDGEERVHGYDSSAARRKTSAAASWNPAGRSRAVMLRAISSISPIQRQPLRLSRALGPGEPLLELGHRQPPLLEQRVLDSLRQRERRTVSSRAALPFVQPA